MARSGFRTASIALTFVFALLVVDLAPAAADLEAVVTAQGSGVIQNEVPGLMNMAAPRSIPKPVACAPDIHDADRDGDTTECDPWVCGSRRVDALTLALAQALGSILGGSSGNRPGVKPSAEHVLVYRYCTVTLANGGTSTTTPPWLGVPYVWVTVPTEVINHTDVLARLRAEVNPGAPTFASAPVSADGVPQLPMWMWFDSSLDTRVSTTLSPANTIRYVVWAEPDQATFSMGDGGTETCDVTEMEPYINGQPFPTSQCAYTYTRAGSYTMNATMRWNYFYEISTRNTPAEAWDVGATTPFGNFDFPATSFVTVREIQSVK